MAADNYSSALPSPYGTPDPVSLNANGPLAANNIPNAFVNLSHAGIENDDMFFPFFLSGTIDVVKDLGKAVSLDLTSPRTVKLAGAGDTIIGQLKSAENRVIEGCFTGAVMMHGGCRLPYDPAGTAPALGDTVKGGSVPGTVVSNGASQGRILVTAVDTVAKMVEVIFT